MSIRVDDTQLIAGAIVVGDHGLGMLAENVPSTGDAGAGYAYAYISLPTDNGKEVRGLIVTPPNAGTLTAYEDTSFIFEAPDGEYTFDWRLFIDGVDSGLKTETLEIGDSTPAAITGSMSVTETGADTATASGKVLIQGTLSATETGSDTFAAYGGAVSPVTGTMAVTESDHDTATIIGQLLVSGMVDVSEVGYDVFAAIGSALPAITGDMAVSEAGSDILAALGVVTDTAPITAAEVARIVRATSRMKTVTASARVKQVRYEIARA